MAGGFCASSVTRAVSAAAGRTNGSKWIISDRKVGTVSITPGRAALVEVTRKREHARIEPLIDLLAEFHHQRGVACRQYLEVVHPPPVEVAVV